jgi:erythromycin esterase-like protein
MAVLTSRLRGVLHPVTGGDRDYDALIERIGNSSLVLIGEASHGTHEFYCERLKITQRLIQEKGFNVVAVEADWPDAYRVNRYVRGLRDSDAGPSEALEGFKARFPTWMWRNRDVLEFVAWLRAYNDTLTENERKCGFYGLDLYSLFSSIEAVIRYLDKVDPALAHQARRRYSCFDHFADDSQAYGYAAAFGVAQSCQDEVVNQLTELRRRASELRERDGHIPPDEHFFAEQNAWLVKNAEEYYRSMFGGRVSSWNLRDRHMAETLDSLLAYLGRNGREIKAVIWEHNSHLGDARFTEMGRQGELNVGQLVRERYGRKAFIIGFSTYKGTVTAATDWDGPPERKIVRPGLRGSYEELLHETGEPAFYLMFRDDPIATEELSDTRLERAIGVIYRPETERMSHYFHAVMPKQFDAVIHIDETNAVEPLEREPVWHGGEAPETFPTGM